jgi:hypothetical protein
MRQSSFILPKKIFSYATQTKRKRSGKMKLITTRKIIIKIKKSFIFHQSQKQKQEIH